MNILFRGVRLVEDLVSRKCRDFVISRSGAVIGAKIYNDCFLGSSLKEFTPGLAHNFMNYAALLHENRADLEKVKSKKKSSTSKDAKDPIISLIKEDGLESVMQLSEAEKYAKIKNMKLVQVENNRMGKVKYKLENRLSILGKKNKTQRNDMKKIILREEIQSHDLEVKINHILKFIEKGQQVLCSIESSSKGVKLKEILSIFENSQLKNHIINKTESNKGIIILFKKKPTVKSEKPEGISGNNVESSVTEN